MISINSSKYGVIEVNIKRVYFHTMYFNFELETKNTLVWDTAFVNFGFLQFFSESLKVKPLGVIWGKFPNYKKETTIMFDDLRRNFLMNPGNGLRIRF